LKVLALGLAALLWLVIARDEIVERGLRVPLELQQFPEGLELRGEVPSLVDVRVRGSSDALSRLGPGDILAVLDLGGARAGRRLFQLTPDQVRTPFAIEVLQVTPASIAIVLETLGSKWLPVAPWVEGEPAPGYVRGKTSVDPPMVEVIGPESAVKEAVEAITETVSIAGSTGPVTERVPVGFLDPAVRLKNPRLATVVVDVLPVARDRTGRSGRR
jgi:hypothetical protein